MHRVAICDGSLYRTRTTPLKIHRDLLDYFDERQRATMNHKPVVGSGVGGVRSRASARSARNRQVSISSFIWSQSSSWDVYACSVASRRSTNLVLVIFRYLQRARATSRLTLTNGLATFTAPRLPSGRLRGRPFQLRCCS